MTAIPCFVPSGRDINVGDKIDEKEFEWFFFPCELGGGGRGGGSENWQVDIWGSFDDNDTGGETLEVRHWR